MTLTPERMAELPAKVGNGIAGSAEREGAQELVRLIAKDIAKQVAHHIETMYPKAVEGAGKNMLVSVRGCVFNEIISAIEVNDEGEIVARLKRRKEQRRFIKAAYTKIRAQEP